MKRIAIYITASIFYLASCGPIDEWTEASVKRTISNYYFDYEASTQTLNVDDYGSFTYSSNASWCTIEWEYSRVIAVTENNTSSARTATVTIRYGDEIMKTISVEQKGNRYIIGNLMVQKEDIGKGSYLEWYEASNLCDKSLADGYSNWRLPTTDEIIQIYEYKSNIGNFKEEQYWTSSYYGLFNNVDSYYSLHFGTYVFWYGWYYDVYWYARCVRIIN